jgi:hypothetical protein
VLANTAAKTATKLPHTLSGGVAATISTQESTTQDHHVYIHNFQPTKSVGADRYNQQIFAVYIHNTHQPHCLVTFMHDSVQHNFPRSSEKSGTQNKTKTNKHLKYSSRKKKNLIFILLCGDSSAHRSK